MSHFTIHVTGAGAMLLIAFVVAGALCAVDALIVTPLRQFFMVRGFRVVRRFPRRYVTARMPGGQSCYVIEVFDGPEAPTERAVVQRLADDGEPADGTYEVVSARELEKARA